MEAVVFISILLIVWSVCRSTIRYRRESLYKKMEVAFDNIELEVIKQNLVLDSSVVNYLKSIKSILVNKELADIRVMMAIRRMIPVKEWDKLKGKTKSLQAKIPQEIREHESDFNRHFTSLVWISMLNAGFIFPMIYKVLTTIVRRGKGGIMSLYSKYNESVKYEIILSQYQAQNAGRMAA